MSKRQTQKVRENLTYFLDKADNIKGLIISVVLREPLPNQGQYMQGIAITMTKEDFHEFTARTILQIHKLAVTGSVE